MLELSFLSLYLYIDLLVICGRCDKFDFYEPADGQEDFFYEMRAEFG